MAATTDGQLVDIAEPIFERRDVGQDVVLFCRGLPVASFRQGDAIGRDVAIATLIRVGHGLKTDTIAELCGASHGWVCHVRQRLAEGGVGRVVERARRGPERALVGAKEERLREMHADGGSVREIAKALGIAKSVIGREIKRLKLPQRGWRMKQEALPMASGAAPVVVASETVDHAEVQPDDEQPTEAPSSAPELSSTPSPEIEIAAETAIDLVDAAVEALDASDEAQPDGVELVAGARLASGPAEHPCRYAGTLLLCAAAAVLGVFSALDAAYVARPAASVYDAHGVLSALLAAWGAGYGSLEAMHERDARALGVVMGLERSPSVRTLHRAIVQMSARSDAVELNAALMRGVLFARLPERLWFGLDGHFKAYSGDEPIDKGWDSKRRLASKGIADVVVTDSGGFTWSTHPVAAGSALGQHLGEIACTLRRVLGSERPIVVAFDRGGFDFDVLSALDREGFHYVGYVPASVTLPDLGAVAPADDGVGEVAWSHGRLDHRARLIVERDGTSLIPVVTNLTTLIDTATVVEQLRVHRGAQENSFKAARSFVHIDRLVDRGGASRAPDDRPVPNPARAALKSEQHQVAARIADLANETPTSNGRSRANINDDRFWAAVDSQHVESQLRTAPAKVPRVTIEPDAERAQLKTRHRLLLQPLKFAADNARRWLLGTLGIALAPSDKMYDLEATARTLLALLHAPGVVRFEDEVVSVTLELPLPPTPHARLSAALVALDAHTLLFADGRRRVRFRLAPRPTRAGIPGHHLGTQRTRGTG
jgi:transposase